MNNKYSKVLIAVLIICIAIVAGVYIGLRSAGNTENGEVATGNQTTPKNNQFAWGVNTSIYQVDGYVEETAQRQIDIIKKLGVNTVRMTYERSIELEPFSINYYSDKYNDDFVDRLNSADIDIAMIIDGDIIGTAESEIDQEKEGYKLGQHVASRYKGKVKYYQIGNEITGTTVKPSDPEFKGETFEGELGLSYSVSRYKSALGWLKGMSKAIRESDPDAQIVVSGHWVLYDVIEKMIDEGLDFDILGWAWYSEDGLDITKRDHQGQDINLFETLNSFGKKVWVIESNQHRGSYGDGDSAKGELEQSEFIRNFIDYNYQKKLFIGYFVYTLFDNPAFADKQDGQDAHWGLVAVSESATGSPIFTEKKAFGTYQKIISDYLSK